MFIVRDTEKRCLHWDLGGQVKLVARRGVDGLIQPALRPPGGIDDVPPEIGSPRRPHHPPRGSPDPPANSGPVSAAGVSPSWTSALTRSRSRTWPRRFCSSVRRASASPSFMASDDNA